MKYYAIPAREMTSLHIARWTEIHKMYPLYASPYFHPGFTLAAAAVRNETFVGIIENKGVCEGFFPFHRSRGGIARPIGLGLSDYHGVVISPDLDWSAEELMRGCRLKRWEFDHLLAAQKQFLPYHEKVYESPVIDVSEGFVTFQDQLDKAGRKQFKESQRKQRKLQEQVGPTSFSLHSEKKDILRTLMQWKSEQCRRTGTVDYFSLKWCVKFIDLLHSSGEDDFGGMLSCLYTGDTLAAVHFSLYTEKVWHSWFPAYNHELEEYSPGSILLFEIIREASERGIAYIDLGKGISLYKKRVMTGSIHVAEGCASIPSISNHLIHIREKTEALVKNSFLKPLLRIPGKMIKKMERESRYK